MADLRRTYACRLVRWSSSGATKQPAQRRQILATSGQAQLILDEQAAVQQQQQTQTQEQQWQLLHSADQLVALDVEALGARVGPKRTQSGRQTALKGGLFRPLLLPCAFRAPAGQWTRAQWFVQPAGGGGSGAGRPRDTLRRRVQAPLPLEQFAALNGAQLAWQAPAGQLRWAANSTAPNLQHQVVANSSFFALSSSLAASSQRHSSSQNKHSGAAHEQKPGAKTALPASRLLVGPSHLAIEWPRAQLSGRYTLRLLAGEINVGVQEFPEVAEANRRLSKPICDINVIIRLPVELRVELRLPEAEGWPRDEQLAKPEALVAPRLADSLREPDGQANIDQEEANSNQEEPNRDQEEGNLYQEDENSDQEDQNQQADAPASGWLASLAHWLGGGAFQSGKGAQPRRRRARSSGLVLSHAGAPEDWRRVRVSAGPGKMPQLPVLLVGQLVELRCAAAGQPVDSLLWFRNGQLMEPKGGPQSVELELLELGGTSETVGTGSGTGSGAASASGASSGGRLGAAQLVARLRLRLEARDVGVQVFECFGSNALGDRKRAGLLLEVRARAGETAGWTRCPLASLLGDLGAQQVAGRSSQQQQQAPNWWWRAPADSQPAGDEAELEPQGLSAGQLDASHSALIVEGEPVELVCPSGGPADQQAERAAQDELARDKSAHSTPAALKVDWLKWEGKSSVFRSPAAFRCACGRRQSSARDSLRLRVLAQLPYTHTLFHASVPALIVPGDCPSQTPKLTKPNPIQRSPKTGRRPLQAEGQRA